MGIETLAVASILSAVANTSVARDAHKNLKDQRQQQREAKKEAEQTKVAEETKQKNLQDTYRNMKTNLYTGDINGISSNNLIQ